MASSAVSRTGPALPSPSPEPAPPIPSPSQLRRLRPLEELRRLRAPGRFRRLLFLARSRRLRALASSAVSALGPAPRREGRELLYGCLPLYFLCLVSIRVSYVQNTWNGRDGNESFVC